LRHFHARPGTDVGILADVLCRFVPEHRNILQLSFALADPKQLERLLAGAGFRASV
jgi:hypothetical protein